ncbi:MAG: hypothetical protein COW00_17705 [Bdellovibrio sp. CG12_big_fil_rev_8_21_14_0_65_39_13]|nr:MAG: hypothetical protein COW78_06830 [Bdellovibrio sp. CG22_combo_CG10-13_8_21_14_all_39_27]PIQ58114.1 MAG: hypothetical protein COW00_17705 [Bdellovibrio sp. CG12_big_fil_rev_8_21_14_0_65_39_13]PIR32989.1 MAG: hypothetical protein COV37_18000 [Bdellovibrio sp. CG11_big_fil_rev_8_21_14_0_20_39_38]PJB54623.1 MAG: hypothetical protein CO099_00490 [Bdellovibrio sp. CG_4_9_14_3_um_filter_39_7]
MAKSGGSNYGVIFGIGALIGIGLLLKVVLDHNGQLIAQEEKIQTLNNQIVELKTSFEVALGTIDTKLAATRLEALENTKTSNVQTVAAENPYVQKVPAKMSVKKGYFCQSDNSGKSTIVFFEGDSNIKAWADTDDTLASIKGKSPDTVGTYKISNGFLYLSLVQAGKRVNRRAAIITFDEDGVITEFDYYNNIFSALTCPF